MIRGGLRTHGQLVGASLGVWQRHDAQSIQGRDADITGRGSGAPLLRAPVSTDSPSAKRPTWSGSAKRHGSHIETEAHTLDRQHAHPLGKAYSTISLQMLEVGRCVSVRTWKNSLSHVYTHVYTQTHTHTRTTRQNRDPICNSHTSQPHTSNSSSLLYSHMQRSEFTTRPNHGHTFFPTITQRRSHVSPTQAPGTSHTFPCHLVGQEASWYSSHFKDGEAEVPGSSGVPSPRSQSR